jgi:2-oxoglutarate/2-oxoacid ferredoxin oxidoreductase subunit alpha
MKTVNRKPQEITIGLAGAAGDGLDRTGYNLANVASRLGLHVYAYNSYQSLIRGGHTWLRLRVGERKVWTQGDVVNVVIALNQDSIERHAREIQPGGVLLFNGDSLRCPPELAPEGVMVLPLPFKQLTAEMGKLLPVMQNTLSVGALMHLIGLDFEVLRGVIADTFGRKGGEIIEQNVAVAQAGYRYASEQAAPLMGGWSASRGRLPFLTGNVAFAMGATAGGCKFYAAYPMSPASGILHWFCDNGARVGVVVKQCEDELAVANITIGAGHAGVRAMCATSGGGFALMTEAIGMAGMIEVPAVFINVQRGGPSTGIPTKTEQGDLNQVFGASQGDYPRAIIAPTTLRDCYYSAAEALNLAEQFQIPVTLVSDLMLSEHRETLETDDLTPDVPIHRGELLREVPAAANGGGYKRYAMTPSGVSPRVLPGTPGTTYVAPTDEHDEEGVLISDEHTNASLRRKMQEKRMRKMDALLAQLPPPVLEGPSDAEITLIGWGSTWGVIHEAVEQLNEAGIAANHLHFRYLVPFHAREAREILDHCKRTAVVEANYTGQFARHLRAETGFSAEALILRYDGEPFDPGEVAQRAKAILAGQPVGSGQGANRWLSADLRVSEAEAREMAYHYIRIHLGDKARPVRFTPAPANGYGEPVWQIDIADRKSGQPVGELMIGQETGSMHEWRARTP